MKYGSDKAANNSGYTFFRKEETVSTNSDAREFALHNRIIPAVFVSERQTGGRGRQGKSFLQAEDGLYMSVLLPASAQTITGVTCMTAVAAAEVIGRYTECGIKWVNDIYTKHGKLCGILCESVADHNSGTTAGVIIGIGINIKGAPKVDSDVPAASLDDDGVFVSRDVLCAEIADKLYTMYSDGFRLSSCIGEYRKKSILTDREIMYIHNGVSLPGTVRGIADDGGLIVETDTGIVVLRSGEVSVRLRKGEFS